MATVEIKSRIEEMQRTTSTTIEEIMKISDVIVEINSVINGIASAVEELSSSTDSRSLILYGFTPYRITCHVK